MYALDHIRGPSALRSVFDKSQIRAFNIFINGDKFPVPFMIGNKRIYTTGIPKLGRVYDPNNACVEIVVENSSRCGLIEKSYKGERLYVNSYYDEPNTACNVQNHKNMFYILKLLAHHLKIKLIELLDGSRIKLPNGSEWNLRILNRLYKMATEMPEESISTFYEKFGFVSCVELLRGYNKPRVLQLKQYISKENLKHLKDNHIPDDIDSWVKYIHEVANDKAANDKAHFVNSITADIKRGVAALHRRDETTDEIRRENSSYYFKLNPTLNSTCTIRRSFAAIESDKVDGYGEIRFIISPEELSKLDTSNVTGGSKSRKKRVTLGRSRRRKYSKQ